MNPEKTRDECEKCLRVNTLLGGICCKCGWNNKHHRQATEEEATETMDKLDGGIAELEVYLGKDICTQEDADAGTE